MPAVNRKSTLKDMFPDIAAQWHPTKNHHLTPEIVGVGSHKRVWWKCDKGPDHEWETQINFRTITRSGQPGGSPFCAGYMVSVTNSLVTLNLGLAPLWHLSAGLHSLNWAHNLSGCRIQSRWPKAIICVAPKHTYQIKRRLRSLMTLIIRRLHTLHE